jgi:hypothetical protein
MSSRLLPLGIVGLFLSLTGSLSAATEPFSQKYDLRVYGPIAAQEQPSLPQYGTYRKIRLTAQTPAQAQIVLSKILRDYTTLPTVVTRDVSAGGVTVPALSFSGGRSILPVLRAGESSVDVYLFDDPNQFARFLASAGSELKGALSLTERKYPYFLEFWDRHAMGSWYSLMILQKGFDFTDDGDFSFMKTYGLNVNTPSAFTATAVRADRYGIGYKFNRWFDDSTYAYDAHPEGSFTSDPDMTFMSDYYGDVPFSENPVERGQMGEMIHFLQQFTGDEFLTSITDPHGETGPGAEMYEGYRDRDEFSRQDLIHYLRDLRGLSLSDLGRRWYGAPDRFKDWQVVRFPREREFYGWKDGVSQDLSGTWKLKIANRAAGTAARMYQADYDDADWFPFRQPGTQYLSIGRPPDRRGGWLRFSFTPDPALLRAGKPVYLTICPFNYSAYDDPSTVYLNGQKIADFTLGHGLEWGQVDVTALLKPGSNLLAVYDQNGAVGGPTFLTLNKYEPLPTSDPGLNARQYDVREWVADVTARANSRYIEYLRGIDPARPIKLMAFDSMIDDMMPNLERLGGYPHCTGESAYYRPWFKRYGYLRGVNDSSEPSQPARNVAELKNLFFTMTLEGMNAHDYFIHLHNILSDPEQKAWYTANLPYFDLMGRFDLKKPDIAIARSARVTRVYNDDSMYENDPGRGDIEQAHFSYVFCSERDLADRLLDGYKIIVDDNFHTLNPEDVDHLEAWVRQGGTLVLNQRSGRSTFLKADTWPIARLTGCAASLRPQEGTVKFESNPAILKAYAGQTFANKGESIDWQKHNYYQDSIALDPQSPDVAVVARYDDGKPAIVTRPLGKGRVVVLGSAFYRHSADIAGFWQGAPEEIAFYRNLFTDLGAEPVIQSDQDKLWSERFLANSGSTEMLVLGNQSATDPLKGAAAVWNLGFTPSRIFDPATGADISAKIDGTKVTLDGLDIPPKELRYFAVERTDMTTLDTLRHWLFRQGQLWHVVPEGRPMPPLDPSWPIRLLGDFSVKQFDSEADARKALAPRVALDADWHSQMEADWASSGLRRGTNVWGVYRKTFTVTPAWLHDLRGVEVMWRPQPFNGVPDEMAINGLTVVKNDAVVVDPAQVLAVLKPGDNLFTFLSRGRASDGNGGFTGNLAFRRIPGASGENIDISQGWTAYGDNLAASAVDFPGHGDWTLVRKAFTLPAAKRGASVWLEAESGNDGGPAVVGTNGRTRYCSNGYGAPFNPKPFLVNITPDVRWGEENDLVLARGGILNGRLSPLPTDIKAVHLILVPPPK